MPKDEVKEEAKEESLLKLGPNLMCEKGKHKFHSVNSLEVSCGCGLGYALARGMELWPDGHIYYDNSIVI